MNIKLCICWSVHKKKLTIIYNCLQRISETSKGFRLAGYPSIEPPPPFPFLIGTKYVTIVPFCFTYFPCIGTLMNRAIGGSRHDQTSSLPVTQDKPQTWDPTFTSHMRVSERNTIITNLIATAMLRNSSRCHTVLMVIVATNRTEELCETTVRVSILHSGGPAIQHRSDDQLYNSQLVWLLSA